MLKIHDDLTGRTDISPQRKAQLRNNRAGKCYCGKPLVNKCNCVKCRDISRRKSLARYHAKFPPHLKAQRVLIRRIKRFRERLASMEADLDAQKESAKK